MRLLPVQDLNFDADDNSKGNIKYQEMVIQVLRNPPERGFDPKTMRDRVKVVTIIEEAFKADPELTSYLLEDADWTILRDAVNKFSFAFAHAVLLKFVDSILEAKAVSRPKPSDVQPLPDGEQPRAPAETEGGE